VQCNQHNINIVIRMDDYVLVKNGNSLALISSFERRS
jgi:hypothetical protein